MNFIISALSTYINNGERSCSWHWVIKYVYVFNMFVNKSLSAFVLVFERNKCKNS